MGETRHWSMTEEDLYQSVMVPERYEIGAMLFTTMASLKKDGSPIIVPLGFIYDREYFYLTIAPSRGGALRLRRDPRVSLNFQTTTYPPHFITITGRAEEIADPDHAISLRISHRYPKAHAGVDEASFDKDWLALGRAVFRIKPEKVTGNPFNRPRPQNEFQGAVLPHEIGKLKALRAAGGD